MIRLHVRPLSPLPSENCLSFSFFLCVAGPACWWERGGGGGLGAESYDRNEDWSSINHSILSGSNSFPHELAYTIFDFDFKPQLMRPSHLKNTDFGAVPSLSSRRCYIWGGAELLLLVWCSRCCSSLPVPGQAPAQPSQCAHHSPSFLLSCV